MWESVKGIRISACRLPKRRSGGKPHENEYNNQYCSCSARWQKKPKFQVLVASFTLEPLPHYSYLHAQESV